MRSILRHMTHRRQNIFFMKWKDHLRQAKLLRRCLTRLVHLRRARALRGWVDFVDVRLALRLRIRVAVARWRSSLQSKGFYTWHKAVALMSHVENAIYENRERINTYETLVLEAGSSANAASIRAATAEKRALELEEEVRSLPIRLTEAMMDAEEVREKLLKSEEARRKLRDAVDRAKKELEEIRSLGKKWQHAAHALKKKERNTLSLRLQYEALLRTHQELRAQVHSIAWREGAKSTIVNLTQETDTARLMLSSEGSPQKIGVLVLKDVTSPAKRQ